MSRFAYAAAPNLNIVFFAETGMEGLDEQAIAVCEEADLIVALGNVNLDRLAAAIPPNQAALCVLGSRDPERRPPAPFRALHGGGVSFKDWRVAGLSGGVRSGLGNGFYIDDSEARSLLKAMPACDLLLSHAAPAGLAQRGAGVREPGLLSLREYIAEKEPIYHFYAHHGNDHVDDVLGSDGGRTWAVGVNGMLYPEPLRFV